MGYALAPFTAGQSLWLVAAGMAISAYQANQAGQLGAWFAGAAVSMAIGFAFPMPGIVNPFMRAGIGALRGAAIGAISGGVASVAAGGSFGAGAAQGAMGGAAAGAAVGFFTSQHYQNWAGGKGFVSNATLQGKMASGNFQAALDEAVANGNRQVSIDERFIDKTDLIYRLRGGGEGGSQSAVSRSSGIQIGSDVAALTGDLAAQLKHPWAALGGTITSNVGNAVGLAATARDTFTAVRSGQANVMTWVDAGVSVAGTVGGAFAPFPWNIVADVAQLAYDSVRASSQE